MELSRTYVFESRNSLRYGAIGEIQIGSRESRPCQPRRRTSIAPTASANTAATPPNPAPSPPIGASPSSSMVRITEASSVGVLSADVGVAVGDGAESGVAVGVISVGDGVCAPSGVDGAVGTAVDVGVSFGVDSDVLVGVRVDVALGVVDVSDGGGPSRSRASDSLSQSQIQ